MKPLITIDYVQCYKNRFSETEKERKHLMWKLLCEVFFQKFVGRKDTVIDIGAGYCEFINNIKCGRKIAIDINSDIKKFANKNVEVSNINIFNLPKKFENVADVIFITNFLEHLDTKDEVVGVLVIANKLLKNHGKLILVQPNIDLTKESYWDYIDHKVVLNTKSIEEAINLSGFQIKLFIKKFLPYTTKAPFLPISKLLLQLYLLIPQAIRPFTGQSLVVAYKK